MLLAELKDVAPRAVWEHEARDFTPWLAENLERLSQAIGIPLELEGTEVQVEQFAADIVAVDPEDGSRVLIENQLAASDHDHLGKILTYLAGVQADRGLGRAALRGGAPVGRALAETTRLSRGSLRCACG